MLQVLARGHHVGKDAEVVAARRAEQRRARRAEERRELSRKSVRRLGDEVAERRRPLFKILACFRRCMRTDLLGATTTRDGEGGEGAARGTVLECVRLRGIWGRAASVRRSEHGLSEWFVAGQIAQCHEAGLRQCGGESARSCAGAKLIVADHSWGEGGVSVCHARHYASTC